MKEYNVMKNINIINAYLLASIRGDEERSKLFHGMSCRDVV